MAAVEARTRPTLVLRELHGPVVVAKVAGVAVREVDYRRWLSSVRVGRNDGGVLGAPHIDRHPTHLREREELGVVGVFSGAGHSREIVGAQMLFDEWRVAWPVPCQLVHDTSAQALRSDAVHL
jgi:hypothetical protein